MGGRASARAGDAPQAGGGAGGCRVGGSSTGSIDGGSLGRDFTVRPGGDLIIQTALASLPLPLCLAPSPAAPRTEETELGTDTRSPGGSEFGERLGWGCRSLGLGWGSGVGGLGRVELLF